MTLRLLLALAAPLLCEAKKRREERRSRMAPPPPPPAIESDQFFILLAVVAVIALVCWKYSTDPGFFNKILDKLKTVGSGGDRCSLVFLESDAGRAQWPVPCPADPAAATPLLIGA